MSTRLHDVFPLLLSTGLLAYAALVVVDHWKRIGTLCRPIRRDRRKVSRWKIVRLILVMFALGLSGLYPVGKFLHENFPDIC